MCNGTTIPRQFMHSVIQAFVGPYTSDTLKFENLDCNSSRYTVNIGESGTGMNSLFQRAKMSRLYRLSRNHSKKMRKKLPRKCRRMLVVQ